MSDVVLCHPTQGRTIGVVASGRRLRDAGHRVTWPDVDHGHT